MEEVGMRRRFIYVTALFVTTALVAGCAGARPSTRGLAAAAVAPVGDLSGTWHGTFGQVGAVLYEAESNSVLRINPDGTFTATVTKGLGTNNLAKPSTLSGTVVTNGKRVTLRNAEGPWPWIVLTRSGDDILYGLANDPAVQAPVMIKFEREGAERR
jgi:hypothetical protein